jgi:hypothetical protein
VIVADLLNLETEVENIQLGVNQLRSIPSMPEDDIFSTDWATSAAHTGVGNVNSFNATFPPGNDSSNDSQRTDPFGDSFNSSSSFGNAFQSSLSSKDLFQTGQNVSLPFVQQSVNPFENGKTTSNKSPTLFSTDNAWPGTNGVNVSPTTLQQSTNVSNGFPLLFPNDKM